MRKSRLTAFTISMCIVIIQMLSCIPVFAEVITISDNNIEIDWNKGNTDATLITAGYDENGVLSGINTESVSLSNGIQSQPLPDVSGVTTKIMLWDSVSGMRPLCEAAGKYDTLATNLKSQSAKMVSSFAEYSENDNMVYINAPNSGDAIKTLLIVKANDLTNISASDIVAIDQASEINAVPVSQYLDGEYIVLMGGTSGEIYRDSFTAGEQSECYIVGDANMNGVTTLDDVSVIMQHDIGNQELLETSLIAADCNFDGKVNSRDALELLKYYPEINDYMGSIGTVLTEQEYQNRIDKNQETDTVSAIAKLTQDKTKSLGTKIVFDITYEGFDSLKSLSAYIPINKEAMKNVDVELALSGAIAQWAYDEKNERIAISYADFSGRSSNGKVATVTLTLSDTNYANKLELSDFIVTTGNDEKISMATSVESVGFVPEYILPTVSPDATTEPLPVPKPLPPVISLSADSAIVYTGDTITLNAKITNPVVGGRLLIDLTNNDNEKALAYLTSSGFTSDSENSDREGSFSFTARTTGVINIVVKYEYADDDYVNSVIASKKFQIKDKSELVNPTEKPDIEYTPGKVKFSEKVDFGKLIAAQYDKDGILSNLKTYEVTDTNEFNIPLSDATSFNGDVKFMLWNDFNTCVPKVKPSEKSFVALSSEDIDESKSDVENGSIYFYPPKATRGSIRYSLDDVVEYYVNGVEMGIFDNAALRTFICNDNNAVVTLQRDSNSSKYNTIMITTYKTAVVDKVIPQSDCITIELKDCSDGESNAIDIYMDNNAYSYSFILGNDKINPSELKENDILTIVCDGTSLTNSRFYDVKVSRTTVEGRCTSIRATGDEFKISSIWYETVGGMSFTAPDIVVEYKCYLDIFGKVAYLEEIEHVKNLGILADVYKKANGDSVALIITKDGIEEEYFINEKYFSEYQALIKSGNKNDVYPQQVVEYKLNSSGNLTIVNNEALIGTETNGEYNKNASTIGSFKISDDTVIVDITNIDAERHGFRAISKDNLIDENKYKVYGYDRSTSTGIYRYILIIQGNIIAPEEKYTNGIGILKDIYQKASGDWVAGVIAEDGSDKEFILYEENIQKYKELISDSNKKTEVYPKQVIRYKVNLFNELTIEEVLTGVLINGTYSKSDSEIGSLAITDTTKIVDISNVDEDKYNHSSVLQDRLVDNEEYTLYSYRNSDAEKPYDFILLTSGNVIEEYTNGIGILKNVYQKANGDWMTTVITKEGDEEEYRIDYSSGEEYADYLESLASGNKCDRYLQQVIDYTVTSSGQITINKILASNGTESACEYNLLENSIGIIRISEDATIIDLSKVNSTGNVTIISKDNLIDGCAYTVYGYNQSEVDGTYKYILITEGTEDINRTSQLAVFLESGVDLDDNGDVVDTITMYYNNEEVTFMVDRDSDIDVYNYGEGDLIMFTQDNLGYIQKVYSVFRNNDMFYDSYYNFKDMIFNDLNTVLADDLSDILSSVKGNVDVKFGVLIKNGENIAFVTDIIMDYNGDCYVDLDKAINLVTSDSIIYTYNFRNSWKHHNRIVLNENLYGTPNIENAHENGDISSNKYYISDEEISDSVVFAVVRTINGNNAKEIYQIISE